MLPDAVTLDVILDVLFDDMATANAKLAAHGLKAIPDTQFPGAVTIVSIADGHRVGNIARTETDVADIAPEIREAQQRDETENYDQVVRRFIRSYEREETPKFDPETDDLLARLRTRPVTPETTPEAIREDDNRLARLAERTRTVESTSDQRTINNVMRHGYRVLSQEEKEQMGAVKDMGLAFWNLIDSLGSDRELSNAKTRIEEAVMWATKSITK